MMSTIEKCLKATFLLVLGSFTILSVTSTSKPQESYAQQVNGRGTLIVNKDLVTLTVNVADSAGHAVAGLSKRSFTIIDDASLQDIVFFSDADSPASIAIVFDLSESMTAEKIKRATDAFAHFSETSLAANEYSLIGFNESPRLLLDRTRDTNALLEKLSAAVPHGGTALYDACYLGVERLKHGSYSKRVLLLISDGQDNESRYNLDQARRMLRESDAVLYSIGVADPIALTGKAGARVRATLDGLAEVAGGRAFYPSNTAEMDQVCERIAIEIRHQYSIGYRPHNFLGDGKWHHIKVKVRAPIGTAHVFVRTREGYYARPGGR
jgi:Ca-activated chloride channel homolog